MTMSPEKRARLEAAGYAIGDTDDFLDSIATDGRIHDPVPLRWSIWYDANGRHLFENKRACRRLLWLAALVLTIGIVAIARLAGAQRAPVPAREVPPETMEATIGVSAQVIAATDPLQQEPEAPVRWTVQYPMRGRRDYLLVWPEGL